MEYFDIYKKRLNRYGTNYQDRVQNQREKSFALRLLKSNYRVDVTYYPDNNEENIPITVAATLERGSQSNTETLQYLFTEVDVLIPPGTILEIPKEIKKSKTPIPAVSKEEYENINYPEGRKYEINHWMIFYPEEIQVSGYNKYIVLKMTHFLEWEDRTKTKRTSWAYMYGQQDNMLKDEIRSRSRMDTIYAENLKGSFFVMPATPYIRKDDYFVVKGGKTAEEQRVLEESYRVTGYDIQSTEGVEYVTIDPIYTYDESEIEIPKDVPTEEETDYFWLQMDNTGKVREVE